MERIFEALHEVFEIAEDAEITVEANPGTVTQEKLSAYRKTWYQSYQFWFTVGRQWRIEATWKNPYI